MRWRCVDLRGVIKKRFGVDLDEASMRNSTASIGRGPPIASLSCSGWRGRTDMRKAQLLQQPADRYPYQSPGLVAPPG